MSKDPQPKQASSSFIIGAIALVFLAIGYQTALLVHRAATLHIASARDRPDTVYVIDPATASHLIGDSYDGSAPLPGPQRHQGQQTVVKRNSAHSGPVRQVREQQAERERSRGKVESFRFDPNTVSIEDLIRLGFSPRQAEAIDNYRSKGGRFRRKEDFAKSYVVEDSVYRRLEPFINIPRLDINRADSAAFDALPGIGGYYAAKMVAYRRELRGYSYPEQLMDLYRFDREKFDGLKDLITTGPSEPYPLWSLPEDSLSTHPYISRQAAHGIVLFRQHNSPEACSGEALANAGILSPEDASRLSRCRIEPP